MARQQPFAHLRLDPRDTPRECVDDVAAHNRAVDDIVELWPSIDAPEHNPLESSWTTIQRCRDRRRDIEASCLQDSIRLAEKALVIISKIDAAWTRQLAAFECERPALEATTRDELLNAGFEDSSDAGRIRLASALEMHPVLSEHESKCDLARRMIHNRLPEEKRIIAARNDIEHDLQKTFRRWSEAHV